MHIELKKIDKDTLKVGDVVGVARKVSCGWKSSFRHQLITSAKITRITPKRTKIETDQFGEHDKNEIFYEYDENAEKENELAIMFKQFKDRRRAFEDFDRKYGLGSIKDEDIINMAYHMKAITEILKKYKE
jgi:hypothetical protein|nr:MAG TPA: hypothetical protein [Caudoviricetes sp.]